MSEALTLALHHLVRSWIQTCALLFVLTGPALADASPPPIPDTPAGRVLGAWLGAFDSGDSERIESFANAHAPWIRVSEEMNNRARTGGYDLVSIEGSGKLWIAFHVKEKEGETRLSATLVVRSNDPDYVSLLSFRPVDPNFTEIELGETERSHVDASHWTPTKYLTESPRQLGHPIGHTHIGHPPMYMLDTHQFVGLDVEKLTSRWGLSSLPRLSSVPG